MCIRYNNELFGRQRRYDILATIFELKNAGIDTDLLIDSNDFGFRFDEIADYLDRSSGISR
jgi:hypothetical protein